MLRNKNVRKCVFFVVPLRRLWQTLRLVFRYLGEAVLSRIPSHPFDQICLESSSRSLHPTGGLSHERLLPNRLSL